MSDQKFKFTPSVCEDIGIRKLLFKTTVLKFSKTTTLNMFVLNKFKTIVLKFFQNYNFLKQSLQNFPKILKRVLKKYWECPFLAAVHCKALFDKMGFWT